jgi:predicted nucleic acid-binding protein
VTHLLFPDTTVLVNFAIINRMDLLARLANGNGQWCATVATECAMWSTEPHLVTLRAAREIFGPPLRPTGPELQDTQALRYELARPGEPPTRHLGEAETIAIVTRRQLRCFFATDDNEASRLAARNGVPVASTWSLLKAAHRTQLLDADTFWGYAQTLRAYNGHAPRVTQDRPSFDKWLGAPGIKLPPPRAADTSTARERPRRRPPAHRERRDPPHR